MSSKRFFKSPRFLKRLVAIVAFSLLALASRAQTTAKSDSAKSSPQTTTQTTDAQTDQIGGCFNAEDAPLPPVDTATVKTPPKKEHAITISLSDLRGRFTADKIRFTSVVGFEPLWVGPVLKGSLHFRYEYGMKAERTFNNVRFETGYFVTHEIKPTGAPDFYEQGYLRASFNFTPPEQGANLNQLTTEIGQYNHRVNGLGDDGGYIYATYDKTLKWLHPLGKKQFGRAEIGIYGQTNKGETGPGLQSYGVRGNILVPFNKVMFKIVHIDGRIGPSFNFDTRSKFSWGLRIERNFSRFRAKQ